MLQRFNSPVQMYAAVLGVVFLAVAVLGFIPGITTNYDDLGFAGKDSGAELLGLFQVSVLHNIVHGLFGVLGLVLARTWDGARLYLVGGGLVYVLLFVYGLVVSESSDANFVPFNDADDVLHVGLAVAMIGGGLLLGRRTVGRPAESL